jgi:CRP-like cAMP-binding protein
MDRNKIKPQTFLSRVPLFNTLQEEELDRIALGCTELRAERGDLIFQRGDPCTGFHVVLYGRVKLAFHSAHGAEKVIELIGPGHSFGEALMFMNSPYIVTAQATEDSLLLHVAKPAIYREIENAPAFACKMLAGLSQRMHSLMSDLESYALRSGTERVAAFLLKQPSQEAGGEVSLTLPVSKAVLASRLSLTPEHFSRIMAELSARHLIAFKGRKVAILDPAALRLCAG